VATVRLAVATVHVESAESAAAMTGAVATDVAAAVAAATEGEMIEGISRQYKQQ
jgi:formaldehyde-activating enzyme involved in methanogenesis